MRTRSIGGRRFTPIYRARPGYLLVDRLCRTVQRMNSHDTLLASAFTERIRQIGLSRRELTKRTGLSRQTLHNIEHEGNTHLKPATLEALDKALHWSPGTAYALANGDASVLEARNGMTAEDMEAVYRWRIVARIQRMPMAELERLIANIEWEAVPDEAVMPPNDVVLEQRIAKMIDERLQVGRLADA